jgi:hypothetical protein
MSFKALFYAYVLGGLTLLPLVAFGLIFFTIYTSVPVGDPDTHKDKRNELEERHEGDAEDEKAAEVSAAGAGERELNDLPKPRKSWLTMRRTFEETDTDGSYVSLVRGFMDARSKDPKRARPKDMWLAVLKGTVLFLYEDEEMTECEGVLDLAAHEVVIYPEGQLDAELFSKRSAVMLRPRVPPSDGQLPSITKEMKLADDSKSIDERAGEEKGSSKKRKRPSVSGSSTESGSAMLPGNRRPTSDSPGSSSSGITLRWRTGTTPSFMRPTTPRTAPPSSPSSLSSVPPT